MSTGAPTKQKLWGGRFTGKTDPLMHAFNQSLSYDKRMHDADIRGSIAYAKALCLAGILTKEEEGAMVQGLQRVGKEWQDGTVSRNFVHQSSSNRSLSLKSERTMKTYIQPTSVV